eukprot:2552754-Prymnesium_polylepis.1
MDDAGAARGEKAQTRTPDTCARGGFEMFRLRSKLGPVADIGRCVGENFRKFNIWYGTQTGSAPPAGH